MHVRHALPGLFAALLFATGAGCGKSESNETHAPPPAPALSADTIARVHWRGKKRLGVEAGAYYFMRIWALPESNQLEARTLDKLSAAPWRLLHGEAAMTNTTSALLRPLLHDIVREECYLEIRRATNQPEEFAFAIRLDDRQAGLWRTNLAAVVSSRTDMQGLTLQAGGRGWSITSHRAPNLVELTHVGQWTVVGAAQKKNALLGEIVARLQNNRAPLAARATNFWLQADLDLSRVAGALSNTWTASADWPRISVAVSGDGANVHTHGELTFPKPFPLELEPWTIPTNLIREPLTSFTAARGLKPWLAAQQFWTNQWLGTPPDQIYFWALDGAPLQTCFAAPLPDASNQVHRLTEHLMEKGNPWLAAHGYVGFERLPDGNGVRWGNQPNLLPFLKSVISAQGAVVFGGLLPDAGVANPPPPVGIIQDLLRRTNLVYYDWEVTGPRINSWLHLGQLFREISRRPTLPLDSAGAVWLRPLLLRLGTCATSVTRTGPNHLTFARKSTLALTAVELHLLADWLESPQFPRGLHTLRAPPPEAPPAAPRPR